MRVQMPEVREQRRWKRSRVVRCMTEEEVADLVAEGGVLLPEDPKPDSSPKAKKEK